MKLSDAREQAQRNEDKIDAKTRTTLSIKVEREIGVTIPEGDWHKISFETYYTTLEGDLPTQSLQLTITANGQIQLSHPGIEPKTVRSANEFLLLTESFNRYPGELQ